MLAEKGKNTQLMDSVGVLTVQIFRLKSLKEKKCADAQQNSILWLIFQANLHHNFTNTIDEKNFLLPQRHAVIIYRIHSSFVQKTFLTFHTNNASANS